MSIHPYTDDEISYEQLLACLQTNPRLLDDATFQNDLHALELRIASNLRPALPAPTALSVIHPLADALTSADHNGELDQTSAPDQTGAAYKNGELNGELNNNDTSTSCNDTPIHNSTSDVINGTSATSIGHDLRNFLGYHRNNTFHISNGIFDDIAKSLLCVGVT